MLLTLTATASQSLTDARDIGFLLHKNPDALFEKELPFGVARLFYPEATAARCTAALWLQIDPVALVRGLGATLSQYVSDRPYAASSFLAVVLSSCLASALGGRSKERPQLTTTPIPLSATLHALVCDAGERLIRALLEPLGYTVAVTRLPLDERFPEWGRAICIR